MNFWGIFVSFKFEGLQFSSCHFGGPHFLFWVCRGGEGGGAGGGVGGVFFAFVNFERFLFYYFQVSKFSIFLLVLSFCGFSKKIV